MIQVDLDSKQIEQAVIDAVISSALGDSIKSVLDKSIEDFAKDTFGGRNPLKTAIEAEVQRIVLEMVRDEYSEKLRAAVRERMTDDVIGKLVDAAWAAFYLKLHGEDL